MATLTIRQQKPTTLASKAEECMASFQQCLNKAALVHPRELSLVEDQLARFSVWAGNMRVFGSMRQSLDHRLREAQEVRDTFDALLEAIKYRIGNCTSSLEALDPEQSDGTLKDIDQDFQHAIHGIADQISLLHRLSNTIRRASKEVQNVEAVRAPRICDSEGNDAEDFLQQVFAHYIRDRFPTTSGTIQQRLAGTMILRRKRILYRRSRYETTPIHAQSGPAAPVVTVPRAQPTAKPRQADLHQETEDSQSQRPSMHKSLAQSATTLAPEKFHKASAPTVVSVSKTVALNSHEQLAFPPAPLAAIKRKQTQLTEQRKDGLIDVRRRLEGQDRSTAAKDRTPSQDWEDAVDAVGEIVCPFCFHALPAWEVVDETKWKKHVLGDLDAYVCLFEECGSAQELYSHSSQWLKHMQGHTLRWRCSSKAHGDFICTSREEYIEHMKALHRSRLTDAQLRLLADKSSRPIGQIFESCPLCGIEGNSCSMEEHVIGHLRLLAIKSLPQYDTGGSDGPENASDMVSTKRSRSTIRDFMDAHSNSFTAGSDSSVRHTYYEDYQEDQSSSSGSDQSYGSPAQGGASGDIQIYETSQDPICAICRAPASAACDCEAKAFEIGLKEAESKVFTATCNEVRHWVRTHAEHRVKTNFRIVASQIEDGSHGALPELKPDLAEASGDARETADADYKRKFNQLWCEETQTYPRTLDYFYSLIRLSVPSDDDPVVRDPPLAGPTYKQRFDLDELPEPPEAFNPSGSAFHDSGRSPLDPVFMSPSEQIIAGDIAANQGEVEEKNDDIEPRPFVERVRTLNIESLRSPPSSEPAPYLSEFTREQDGKDEE